MRVKWLHLSDIHFTYKNYNSHDLRDDFINRISALQESEPFTHLFISGDILHQNNIIDDGTDETIKFIKCLIRTMNLHMNNIFIVPGNHDHDRKITEQIIKKYLKSQKGVNSEEKFDNLHQNIISDLLSSFTNFYSVYNNLFDEKYYSENQNPHIVLCQNNLSIIKLNTGWLETNSNKKEGFLQIGSRQLQTELSKYKEKLNGTVNIAIGHHCLKALIDEERKRVLAQFERHNIGIYFCGHEHKPSINHYNDIVEIVAPGGYSDGYSNGGYVSGIIDTETDFYKVEVYSWDNGKWCIESHLDRTDSYGMYYFHTQRFNHNSNIAVVDCKTMNGHIARRQLEQSIGNNNFDLYTYIGLTSNPYDYNEETISDFSSNIEKLIERNKIVHLYPLAEIPMLLLLGFKLQKNTKLLIHQYDRNSGLWVYDACDNNICINNIENFEPNNDVLAFSVSTSFLVDVQKIEKALPGRKYDLLQLKSNQIKLGYPLYKNDVERVADQIINCLNKYISNYREIHFFAAVPAGLAVELGRRMLTSIYSNIYTYQLSQNEYKYSLVINPRIIEKIISNVEFVDELNRNISMLSIAGEIACGNLNDSFKGNYEYYPMSNSILNTGEHFVLMAKGDSMINAGIDDGDYVVIKRQPVANNGEIVVAIVDNETTLKRLYYDDKNQKIILQPENDNYSDMYFDELEIQGIAIQVIKNL